MKVIFTKGLQKYEGSVSNGITSSSKTFSEVTMSFVEIPVVSDIILKTGSRIDVLNPMGHDYLNGVIKEIHDAPEGKNLKIAIERNTF